jgi:hypothetical protein
MQRRRVEPGDIEAVGDGVGIAFGSGEHDGLIDRDIAQQVVKQAILVRQIVDKMHALFDVFVFRVRSSIDLDDQRVTGHLARHVAHRPVERGREKHGLARGPAWRRRFFRYLR